mmetsp:Transcript_9839/g.40326  ORF Transcript_9839/g.40326 Transcript_9839/m.40326 type:complete len:253 (-) Transcript_9839:736-1494(-)
MIVWCAIAEKMVAKGPPSASGPAFPSSAPFGSETSATASSFRFAPRGAARAPPSSASSRGAASGAAAARALLARPTPSPRESFFARSSSSRESIRESRSILSTSGEIVARLFLFASPPPRGLRRPFRMGRLGPLSPSDTSDPPDPDPCPLPPPPPEPCPLPSPGSGPLPLDPCPQPSSPLPPSLPPPLPCSDLLSLSSLLWSESGDLDFSRRAASCSDLKLTPSCFVMEQMTSDCTQTARCKSSSWRSYVAC